MLRIKRDEDATKQLVWNVFVNDNQSIQIYNIFDHPGFRQDVKSAKKKYGVASKEFEEEIRRSLMYYYWSKCEWETVISSWPPYIDSKEYNRIKEEVDKRDVFYSVSVSPEGAQKVDVYMQVDMNWKPFMQYLIAHQDLIK